MVHRKKRARGLNSANQEWRRNKCKGQTEGHEGAEDEKELGDAEDEKHGDEIRSVESIGDVCVCLE